SGFVELFDGDDDKVRELDTRVSRRMGFTRVFPITGQTYTRKLDAQVLAALAGVAQSAAKFATDLRLLQHEGEMLEPFESDQVGSSAMAYKRNPMRAERMTGLARFVIELEGNAWHTAAEQGLERLARDPAFKALKIAVRPDELEPAAYVGRAPRQVDEFLEHVLPAVLHRVEAVAPAAAAAEVTV